MSECKDCKNIKDDYKFCRKYYTDIDGNKKVYFYYFKRCKNCHYQYNHNRRLKYKERAKKSLVK